MTDLDLAISRWLHAQASPPLDVVMQAFTRIGSYFFSGCVVACIAAWARMRGARALAWELVAVSLAAVGLNSVLKNTFERPRPDLFPAVVLPESFSFPSGHSMVSLAAYGTAAFVIAKLHPRLAAPACLAVAIVVPLVGISRVYLGVHWPSDVAAGFAAGGMLLVAARLAIGRMHGDRPAGAP